jgi:protocatechuate 3,4-dioxygenase beta subunit
MKRLLISLALLAAATAARASITATIVDDDGKPLAGARVRAFAREDTSAFRKRLLSKEPATPPVAAATSGDDGRVSLDLKGAPIVHLIADAPGRAVQYADAADGEDAGSILLPQAAAQKGHVTSGGKAVANALVAAGQWYVTHTDAQGQYEVAPLATGGDRLLVIHPDYAIAESAVGPITAPGRRAVLDVVLSRGVAVKGRTLAPDGKTAVPHAVVFAGGWPLAESDNEGKYAIAHAPQQWRAVYATTAKLAGLSTNRGGSAVDIKLTPALSVAGTVKSSRGPVAGAYVTLFSEVDPTSPPSTVSDAKGHFAFEGLVSGRYSLSGAHPGYNISRVPLELPSTAERVLAAEGVAKVRGHVVDQARKPVAGARVIVGVVSNNGQGWPNPSPVTSSVAGEFMLRVPPAASLQFVAVHRGYAAGIAGPVTTEKANDLTITLPAGFPMIFRIIDAQRQPVAGVVVDVARAVEIMSDRRNPLPCPDAWDDCRVTKADGTIEQRVVEGKYDLAVGGEEIAPKRLSSQMLTARSSPMTITVERGVEISGRVVMGDGTPVGSAVVSSRGVVSRGATTGADGTFTLKGLSAGPVLISASTNNATPLMTSAPLSVTAPAKDVVLRMPSPASVSGRVSDKATSQPIADFQIMATTSDSGMTRPTPPSQVHSDDGTFTMLVVPGRTELRVTAAGYVRATLSSLNVEEGKPISGVEVRMERGGRIVGRVTSGGQPVAQAYVSAYADRFNAQSGASTDANGDYVLDGIDAGERTLQARKQGLLTAEKSVVAKAGQDVHADLELEKGREVRGRVIDRGGRPVESTRISVRGVEDRSVRANAAADAEGNFKVGGLSSEGHLTLVAERDGYVAATVDDVDPSQNILVTLDRGGVISGRVAGLADSDMGSVSVNGSYGASSTHAMVDSDGSFTLRGVPDGTVSVSAMKQGAQMRHSAPKQVTVSNGSAPFVQIDFADGLSVRGRVTREGKPVPGGSISFNPSKGGQQGGVATIGPDGTYQVNGLEAGEYRIFISLYGPNAASVSQKLMVSSSMTHDVDLTGGTLRGRVLDASTGAPLSDVSVSLRPMGGDGVGFRQGPTDSDGRFAFDVLPDGQYRVAAQRQGYASKQQDITMPGSDLELRLDGATPTVVRVVDGTTGAPVIADVAASAADNKAGSGSGYHGSSDGTVKLWLASGRYRLNVSAPGYASASADLIVPSPELRVALQRGGTITFRVHGSSDANYRVRLLINGQPQRTDWINMAYRSSLTGITPGTYVAEVTGTDGKTPHGTYPVTVLPGQTAYVDVLN